MDSHLKTESMAESIEKELAIMGVHVPHAN